MQDNIANNNLPLLAIDSSSPLSGVALVTSSGSQHLSLPGLACGEHLLPLISQLLTNSGTEVKSVQTIAVATGPGSYTGLRIGVITAKTLAWTSTCQLVAVNSLDALALAIVTTPQIYQILTTAGWTVRENLLISMDARRGEVYAAVYKFKIDDKIDSIKNNSASWSPLTNNISYENIIVPATAITPEEAAQLALKHQAWAIGSGLASEPEIYTKNLSPKRCLPFGWQTGFSCNNNLSTDNLLANNWSPALAVAALAQQSLPKIPLTDAEKKKIIMQLEPDYPRRDNSSLVLH